MIVTDDKHCTFWSNSCAEPTRIQKGKEYIFNKLAYFKVDENARNEYLFVFENKGHNLNTLVAIYNKQTNRQLYGKVWEEKVMRFWNDCNLYIKYSVYIGTINNNANVTQILIRRATRNDIV